METYYFGHFPQKLHEIEKIGPKEGVHIPSAPTWIRSSLELISTGLCQIHKNPDACMIDHLILSSLQSVSLFLH